MRRHLQNEKLNPSKLVETTLQRISENRYLEIFGPKAEDRKSKERKLSQIAKKIKILAGNVPADVSRKKSVANLNRADWKDKYMLSRKRRELRTDPSESQLPQPDDLSDLKLIMKDRNKVREEISKCYDNQNEMDEKVEDEVNE